MILIIFFKKFVYSLKRRIHDRELEPLIQAIKEGKSVIKCNCFFFIIEWISYDIKQIFIDTGNANAIAEWIWNSNLNRVDGDKKTPLQEAVESGSSYEIFYKPRNCKIGSILL